MSVLRIVKLNVCITQDHYFLLVVLVVFGLPVVCGGLGVNIVGFIVHLGVVVAVVVVLVAIKNNQFLD